MCSTSLRNGQRHISFVTFEADDLEPNDQYLICDTSINFYTAWNRPRESPHYVST